MCFHLFFFFSPLNIQLKPRPLPLSKKVIITLLFSISTVMTMLLMKDFINFYVFLLQTPVCSVAEISHAVFRGYFCSILAD